MAFVYPEGPQSVPPGVAKVSPSYTRRAAIATGVLVAFVLFYLGMTTWFAWKAYKLAQTGLANPWALVAAGCAAFLAFFMVKGLFFVKRGAYAGDIEITAKEEPALFQFIHRLADEARAPRPARVYLSPRVNASVFYDISVLNLLFPSRKSLEIGLGLVNVLTVEEFKAVLAHEFGHFGQRTMLIGRWVYMAQQIAGAIVAKRDVLDDFLGGLSRFDVRVAWVGWILSLVVWSIRSITDSAFRLVVLAQRALSREMEMQADLVAVSLTGSDALINALHRMSAADEAWERSIAFADSEISKGRTTADLYDIQSRTLERMRAILDEPHFGRPPEVPAEKPEAHRVFTAELAEPPRMWATHPSNYDREENAKRVYVAAGLSKRSAWEIFADPQATRETMTTALVKDAKDLPPKATREASLKVLDEQYEHESFKRFYRGNYIARAVTRHAKLHAELYGNASASDLPKVYPDALAVKLKQLRGLAREIDSLEAIHRGFLEPPDGIVRHRGRQLERRNLHSAIEELRKERDTLRSEVFEHDRLCRAAHRAAAAAIGKGWEEYLVGLLQLVHYCEHAAANVRDLLRVYDNTVAIEITGKKVDNKAMARIVARGMDVFNALEAIHAQAPEVELGPRVAERFGSESWSRSLGELKLPAPMDSYINDWNRNVGGWVAAAANGLDALRSAALDELLVSESQVARAHRAADTIADAPAAAKAPGEYPVLPIDGERPLQRKLGWWSRFQVADGKLPEFARFAVAATIVGGVLVIGGDVGKTRMHIYNGLARPVVVSVNGAPINVGAGGTARTEVEPDQTYAIRTVTRDGREIESFDGVIAGAQPAVYNVAGAAPLVEWAAVYGKTTAPGDRHLGPARWMQTPADHVFEEPPKTISTGKHDSGGLRIVLSHLSGDPQDVLSVNMKDEDRVKLILTHAKWDDPTARYSSTWISAAYRSPEFGSVLRQRLAERPLDPLLLRIEQEIPNADRAATCERHRALAAKNPDNADLVYVVTRCIEDRGARDTAFVEAYRKHPANAWLAMAAGYTFSEGRHWADAQEAMQLAYANLAVRDIVLLDLARVKRMVDPAASLDALARDSRNLTLMLASEAGKGADPYQGAYTALRGGRIAQAVAMTDARPGVTARLLRLAAASDGADPVTIAKAMQMSPELGMDGQTLWTSWALAYRFGQDTAPYRKLASQVAREANVATMQAFLDACGTGDAARAEATLKDMTPEQMGHAYAMGLVVMRDRAPKAWREGVRRLLFATERPYFA